MEIFAFHEVHREMYKYNDSSLYLMLAAAGEGPMSEQFTGRSCALLVRPCQLQLPWQQARFHLPSGL